MMQRLWKATHLTLLSLLVVGLGVSAVFAATSTKASAKKKIQPASARGGKSSKRTTTHVKSRRDRGQKAPTASRISEIQQALAKDGSFSGAPNGKWDDSTVNAMKKFQASHGLNASGKLDAKTLQQLGLGSQTAGLGAPTAPVRISSTSGPQAETVNSKQ